MDADRVTLRPATEDDAKRLFDWTNDPTARGVSFNADPIPWDTHVAWLEKKLADRACRLFIAEVDGAPVGQVRLDAADDRATISVSIAKAHRGRGLGVAAIRAATAHAEVIDAFILADNAASVRAFERAGFTFAEDVEIEGRAAVRFEWTRS
ncbi:MAG: GNAT family N-acetyltransferase [Deltaproteobacteria bacterium]